LLDQVRHHGTEAGTITRRLYAVAVGPQKTATTWLARAIGASPDIASPLQVKETFFWDHNYARGPDWYFKHFPPTGTTVEVGPSYFHSQEARCRLRAHNPDLKVIVTLRDPASRAFSLYLHHKRKGRTRADFWQAAEQFPEILEAGHYQRHVSAWIDTFGDEQVLVLTQEQIFSAPESVLESVSVFLGLPLVSDAQRLREKANAGGLPPSAAAAALATKVAEGLRRLGLYRIINWAKAMGLKRLVYGKGGQPLPKLDPASRARLVALYHADISFVESLLQTDVPGWRDLNPDEADT